MKQPIVGTRKRPSKILLASTSLPVALLIAKGLMSPGWGQNSDLDVPTGRTQPSSVEPAIPLPPAPLPTNPVEPVPLDSQPPVTLPPLDSQPPLTPSASEVFVPAGNEQPNGIETPTGPNPLLFPLTTPNLLPVNAPPGQEVVPLDLDTGLGTFSPLYEGGGFGRTVFTPAYLPSYNYSSPNPERYNLNLGPVKARLYAAVVFEYNDNINLGDHGNRQNDFIITPTAGVGFHWQPASGRQSIDLNLGVGYRWYLNHSELNSVIITPSTHAQYNFGIGAVQMNVHDSFTTSVDPITQGQIGATSVNPNSLLNYRRIINVLGIAGTWQASSKISLTGGYDYTIDRTLTDQFKSLDHDEHTFNAGIYTQPTPRLLVGLAGTYTIIDYTRNIQNSGSVWTIGPNARYKVNDNLTIQGSVGYTASSFDSPTAGSILDSSNFRSVTYEAGINHRFNRRWNHVLTVTRGASLGVGSNFADYTAIRYGIFGQLAGPLSLQGALTWEDFKVSGQGGEHANRYLLYVGLRYRLSQSWSSGLGYSYALKESDRVNQDYYQNRVTLDVTYQF